jgi:hypothetical protein
VKAPEARDCLLGIGDEVEVTEPGIRPWRGTVAARKWSSVSGWWIEVRRDGGPETWVMVDTLARKIGGTDDGSDD